MQNVLYYFIAVSVIGAVVCFYDKLAAARGWKRVPERTLFFWARGSKWRRGGTPCPRRGIAGVSRRRQKGARAPYGSLAPS